MVIVIKLEPVKDTSSKKKIFLGNKKSLKGKILIKIYSTLQKTDWKEKKKERGRKKYDKMAFDAKKKW